MFISVLVNTSGTLILCMNMCVCNVKRMKVGKWIYDVHNYIIYIFYTFSPIIAWDSIFMQKLFLFAVLQSLYISLYKANGITTVSHLKS